MSRRPRCWIALGLALVGVALPGCTPRTRPAPTISAVSPSPALNVEAQTLTVTGAGFDRRLISDLDHPDHAELRDGYAIAVWHLPHGEPVELAEVTWKSDTELSAVLPADLLPGAWGVRITDPWGIRVERDDLLEIVAPPCTAASDCDDGIACTTDACEDLQCTHALASGFCFIAETCVEEGADPQSVCRGCVPERSTSEWSPLPDTAACDDGLACTMGDHCDGAGQCLAGATECADAPGDCFEAAGTCTPEGCVYPPKPETAACDDGVTCTADDTCDGAGVCVSGASSCGPLMPTACLTITPTAAEVGAPVTFDASCSTDADAPSQDLVARFDFDGDGTFDTPFGPLTVSAPAGSAGVHVAAVEVRDAAMLTDWAQGAWASFVASDEVRVTTALDEADSDASPEAPGGAGLSLREALAFVDGADSAMTITFAGPMTVSLTGPLELKQEGAVIAGQPGVVLDFSAAGNMSCFSLTGEDVAVIGIKFVGCAGQAVAVKAPGARIASCTFRPDSTGNGAAAKFGASGVFGPGNDVRDFTGSSAVEIKSADVSVVGSHFENGRTALDVTTSGTGLVVTGNELVLHSQAAVQVANSVTSITVWSNTFVQNASGISISGAASAAVSARNNVFTGGSGCALGGGASGYTDTSPNLFFGNGGTACVEAPSATGNVSADPLFIGPDDLRLMSGSPAIDVGVDLGVDLNGPATGDWSGAAPDLGAHEASY